MCYHVELVSPEVTRLADAVDRLCEAAKERGAADVPRRLDADERERAQAVVSEIKTRLQPFGLPADIEWFWLTWYPHSFGQLTGHPHLTDPRFAIDSREDDESWPPVLLPVAYESHCFLAVELEYPDSPGPGIYDYCYAGEGFRLRAPDLAVVFAAAAATFEAGDVVDYGQARLSPGESVHDRYRQALDGRGIPSEERGPFDVFNILSQPARWQRAVGVDASSVALTGATHTIDELLVARRHGSVTGTIVGHGTTRAGTGSGRLDLVRDSTGEVEVWVPGSVPSLGPPGDGYAEYDVVATRLDRSDQTLDDFNADHAEVIRRALAGDIEGAGAAALPMGDFLSRDHPVVATSVRPVEQERIAPTE